MKKLLLILFVSIFGIAAQAQTVNDAQAVITFDKPEHDFGKLKEGTLASHEFTFTNTGKAPLILSNVQPSCGCTTPEWSKEPIMPGGKGKIKAVFNSYGRPGTFQKYITVKSNSSGGDVTLTFKGTVEPTPVEPVSPVRNMMSTE
ncbi:MAG: DUF1573 domain-containing protein [Bacteroidota bacterium]